MAVIALVLLIWLCLNVALVVFRWIHLDRSDELPRHALNTAPLPTSHDGSHDVRMDSSKTKKRRLSCADVTPYLVREVVDRFDPWRLYRLRKVLSSPVLRKPTRNR